MSLVSRLDRIEAALAAKQPQRRDIWRQIVEGEETQEEVLDRMIASGEITEDQRDDVCFIVLSAIEPIWETHPDGTAKFIGRRNVHTGEVWAVDVGGN